MTTHIKVFPAKATALNVHHPVSGKPDSEGVMWLNDVFTARRLTDGSFTTDPSKAYRDAAASTEKAPVPAKATDPVTASKVPPAKND